MTQLKEFLHSNQSRIVHVNHMIILVLSVALIMFISIDTFKNISFLDNHVYMVFQFWVCITFLLIFFIDLFYAKKRWRYFLKNLVYFLICIPYLNILGLFDVSLDANELYFLRFIPLARGALALSIILNYVSKNRITGLFCSYMSIMVLVIYFSSLIFLEREHGVNPDIPNYWTSLWWCCLEATTIGAPINPVTVVGKILAGVLSCMGMMMFPLFTVYLTNVVKRYVKPVAGSTNA